MDVERVTVSLPADLLGAAHGAVAAGAAEDLSALVADALRTQLSRGHALAELERALGGRPPQAVLERVRHDLGLATS